MGSGVVYARCVRDGELDGGGGVTGGRMTMGAARSSVRSAFVRIFFSFSLWPPFSTLLGAGIHHRAFCVWFVAKEASGYEVATLFPRHVLILCPGMI